MRPLTDERPKPLVGVNGKPLLEHIIKELPKQVNKIVVVIGYKGEMIEAYFGDYFDGRDIEYVWQKDPSGTADALQLCEDRLEDRFLVMTADDLHGTDAIERALSHDLCAVVAHSDDPGKFGVIEVDENNHMVSLEEKPKKPKSNLVSTGVLVLDKGVFEYECHEHSSGEHYLTDMVAQYAENKPVVVEMQNIWIPVGYPEDIPKIEKYLKERKG